MNYKKSWSGKDRKEEIITKENSSLKLLEVDMVKLKGGESVNYDEKGKEFALIIISGRCTVTGKDFSFDKIGERKDAFDGKATSVYIGKDTPYTLKAKGEAKIAVCKSPAEKYFKPQLITPDKVIEKTLGKGSYERIANFNINEKTEANNFYIGEFWVKDGNWASFPPHKHDTDNMPYEGQLEEIYYFEFDRPEGFGVQMVYDKEGNIDEAYSVKSGDFIEIPKGYHPFVTAPNYNCYCLWIMAGKDRGIFCTIDESQKWMIK